MQKSSFRKVKNNVGYFDPSLIFLWVLMHLFQELIKIKLLVIDKYKLFSLNCSIVYIIYCLYLNCSIVYI